MKYPWMKLYFEDLDDPKTLQLAILLGDVDAWRLPIALQAWAANHQPDGVVGRLPAPLIAAACRWRGNAEDLVDALRASGWLDEEGRIDGWASRHFTVIEQAGRDALIKRLRRAGKTEREIAEELERQGLPTVGTRGPRRGNPPRRVSEPAAAGSSPPKPAAEPAALSRSPDRDREIEEERAETRRGGFRNTPPSRRVLLSDRPLDRWRAAERLDPERARTAVFGGPRAVEAALDLRDDEAQ